MFNQKGFVRQKLEEGCLILRNIFLYAASILLNSATSHRSGSSRRFTHSVNTQVILSYPYVFL